jgi:hypothetical protein
MSDQSVQFTEQKRQRVAKSESCNPRTHKTDNRMGGDVSSLCLFMKVEIS